MMLDLGRIRADPERSKWMTQKVLCHTLAGNEVPLLTVTSPKAVTDMYRKQVVVLTSVILCFTLLYSVTLCKTL